MRGTISGTRLSLGSATTSSSFLDTIASDRGDNPELAKMGADRIDHRGLLADKQMDACDGASGHSAARGSWSPRTACSPGVTASQMASASAMSFFCRLT